MGYRSARSIIMWYWLIHHCNSFQILRCLKPVWNRICLWKYSLHDYIFVCWFHIQDENLNTFSNISLHSYKYKFSCYPWNETVWSQHWLSDWIGLCWCQLCSIMSQGFVSQMYTLNSLQFVFGSMQMINNNLLLFASSVNDKTTLECQSQPN